jgi:chaperonin GroES
MNNPGFRPNRQRYLVLPTEIKGQETKIEGSEYTIESAKDPHEKPAEGTVVAVGKDCTEFKPGDTVVYGKYSGYEQHLDGVNYLILAESEILGERLVTPFDDEKYGKVTLGALPEGKSFEQYVQEEQEKADRSL